MRSGGTVGAGRYGRAMPHRNRVTPLGEIVAVPERGTLMGNRGVLRDDEGTIRREWQLRRFDLVLHADRLDGRAKRTFGAPRGELPTGAMVLHDGAPWLVGDDALRLWTPVAYTRSRAVAADEPLTVLTPAAAVATIAAGYEPELHPTAVIPVA
jgi:hypothetical protein